MAKTLDYLALSVLLTIVCFVWGVLILKNALLAIIVASSLSLAIVFSVKYFSKNKYRFSPQLLATHFAIMGNEYVINLLKSTLYFDVGNDENFIYLDNCLIASFFKFSMISSTDVCKIARAANKKGLKTAFVLGMGIERKAYQVANYLDVKIKPVKIHALYRYLAKHNALPNLKKTKQKPSFRTVIDIALARSNTKYYIFSGVVLIATSFITPLKLYYLISGSVLIFIAILSLLFGDGNLTSSNAFKELENAAHKDCVSNENQNKIDDK